MNKDSNIYFKMIEAAKIADDSVVWYWEKMLDLDSLKTESLRKNDNKKFENLSKQQESLIQKISWEERYVKKLNKKIDELE